MSQHKQDVMYKDTMEHKRNGIQTRGNKRYGEVQAQRNTNRVKLRDENSTNDNNNIRVGVMITTTAITIIIIIIIIIIMTTTTTTTPATTIIITSKGAIRDFCNLLTASRTISNTHARVARVQRCANHVQHIERLSRATCRVPCATEGQLSY